MRFDWDTGNLEHIAAHELKAIDAESSYLDSNAIQSPPRIVNNEVRSARIGKAQTGRIIVVISTVRGDAVRIVTAYPADQRQQRRYREAQT